MVALEDTYNFCTYIPLTKIKKEDTVFVGGDYLITFLENIRILSLIMVLNSHVLIIR